MTLAEERRAIAQEAALVSGAARAHEARAHAELTRRLADSRAALDSQLASIDAAGACSTARLQEEGAAARASSSQQLRALYDSARNAKRGCEPAPLTRIGTLEGGAPLAVGLTEGPGVLVSSAHSAAPAHDLALALAVSLVEDIPLQHLRVHVYDPRNSLTMAPLGRLREARAESFPAPLITERDLENALDDLLRHASATAELLAGEGERTLSDLWSRLAVPQGEFRVLVLLDYPSSLSDRAREQLRALASSPGRGVCVIAAGQGPGAAPDGDGALAGALTDVRVDRDRVAIRAGGRWAVGAPLAADPAHVGAVVSAAVASSNEVEGPTYPLSEFIEGGEPMWSRSSADGLSAVIGRTRGDALTIRLSSQNPAMPNMLVGGAVGQGKSNLLLDIVYALAYHYGPDELRMLLLDFKEGVEFRRFAANDEGRDWLPHARLVALESNAVFGASVLSYLTDEIRARANTFKEAGVGSYDAYRAQGGSMPRLLVVADEFQMLFEGNDDVARDAVRALEQIARQGRSAGIHLVLASQTLSGIRALANKEQAIFGQFASRLSLKNKAQESETILSRGNRAAADLTYRGEVVLNENFGEDPSRNIRGTCAWAQGDYVLDLQRRMFAAAPQGPAPTVFNPYAPVAWERHDSVPFARGRSAATDGIDLGRRIGVDENPVWHPVMGPRPIGLAIVGEPSLEVDGLIAAAASSLARVRPGAPLTFVVGSYGDAPVPIRLIASHLEGRGVPVRVVTGEGASALLRDGLPADQAVVLVDADQLIDFTDPIEGGDVPRFGEPPSIRSRLADVLHDTSAAGHPAVITAWSSYAALEGVVGRDLRGVSGVALVGQDRRTLHDVSGDFSLEPPEESPRFVYVRPGAANQSFIGVPFSLPTPKEER